MNVVIQETIAVDVQKVLDEVLDHGEEALVKEIIELCSRQTDLSMMLEKNLVAALQKFIRENT